MSRYGGNYVEPLTKRIMSTVTISAQDINKLRQATGAGMSCHRLAA